MLEIDPEQTRVDGPRDRISHSRLIVVEGPGRGYEFQLTDASNRIGRGDGQEVQLAFGDEFVSREGHATIIFYGERDGFILRDGGKANPVLVNGASVRGDQQLRFGDIICIGETALLFSSNEPTGT